MNVRSLKLEIKKQHKERNGERFFSEKALLSALFEKNGLSRDLPILAPDLEPDEKVAAKILSDLSLLLDGYPLQYYLGTEFFCGEEFFVAENVLIPRPETELLVNLGAKYAPKDSLVFDFCCGSGCVGIALLLKRPDLTCISFDLSDAAISLTLKNREKFGLSKRLFVEKVDLLSEKAFSWVKEKSPSMILSNPPYLTEKEMGEIDLNVAREPRLALAGGEDGLSFYRAFFDLAAKTGVSLALEFGKDQKNDLEKLLFERSLSAAFYCDEAGLDRALFLSAQKN